MARSASKKRKYLVVRSFSLPKEDGGHEIVRSFQRDELRKIKTDENGKRLPNYIELDAETAIDFVEKGYIRPA